MSYDLIKTIEYLIESGKGDTGRLRYILNSFREQKHVYLSDQKYLENLLESCSFQKDEKTHEIRKSTYDSDLFKELLVEIRNLNKRLDEINRVKNAVNENEKSRTLENSQNFIQVDRLSKTTQKATKYKNENIPLILSIVLGLFGLPGIGHIYLGKAAKGFGIMSISLILVSSSVYFVSSMITHGDLNLFSILNSLVVVLIIGYLALYIFQIFDAKKTCMIYNKYLSEDGKLPLWW